MIFFTKRNLTLHDYRWTELPKDNSKISGKPDLTLFDRLEGNEVVYLINNLMILWNYRFSNTGNKMERLIREKMPPEILTQEAAKNWIEQNLKF